MHSAASKTSIVPGISAGTSVTNVCMPWNDNRARQHQCFFVIRHTDCRFGFKMTPSRPVDAKQLPPVASGIENPNNRHALGSRFVKDQEVVELSDPPFANSPQLRSPQRKSSAHVGVFAQLNETRFGTGEKSIRHRIAGIFCQVYA
jgi:hypothetical protein